MEAHENIYGVLLLLCVRDVDFVHAPITHMQIMLSLLGWVIPSFAKVEHPQSLFHLFLKIFFFEEDPLWDGKGCENGEICCKFNDPPWFVKELNETTNADVEVRSCGTINSTQDVPVELIEVYIQ